MSIETVLSRLQKEEAAQFGQARSVADGKKYKVLHWLFDLTTFIVTVCLENPPWSRLYWESNQWGTESETVQNPKSINLIFF